MATKMSDHVENVFEVIYLPLPLFLATIKNVPPFLLLCRLLTHGFLDNVSGLYILVEWERGPLTRTLRCILPVLCEALFRRKVFLLSPRIQPQ